MGRIVAIAAALLALGDAGAAVLARDARGARPSQDSHAEAVRAEFKKRRAALAREDAAGHFELAGWCEDYGLKSEATLLLKQVVVIDPNHAEARRLLGYVKHEDKWVLEKDLERLKEKQTEEENRKKGFVKYKGQWVAKEDIPLLEKGMVRHEGAWITKEEAEKIAQGWKRVDGEWISPEEAPNLEKGLLKVEGNWLTKERANAVRADWGKAWRIQREHVLLRTNADRDTADRLATEAEAAYGRVKAIFGKDPKNLPILLFGFRSSSEYNRYAEQFGEDHSSCYGAYLAGRDEDRPGVCSLENKDWAAYFIGHAVGHAFLDRFDSDEEHPIPAWFVEGVASYVERFHNKANRDWSVGQILKTGGLDDPKRFTKAFALSASDYRGSEKMIVQTGLAIGYFVDGADEHDRKLFADAVKAVGGGNPAEFEKAIGSLVRDPSALDKKLRSFAGIK